MNRNNPVRWINMPCMHLTIVAILIIAVQLVSNSEAVRPRSSSTPKGSNVESKNVTGGRISAGERYRRLIPYMTFYLQGDANPGPGYGNKLHDNLLHENRFQQYHQETSFTPASQYKNGQSDGFQIPGYTTIPIGYYRQQDPSSALIRTIDQNFQAVKAGRPAATGLYRPLIKTTTHRTPLQYLTGFRPMDPHAVTITQSKEIPVRQHSQTNPGRLQEIIGPSRQQEPIISVRPPDVPAPIREHEVVIPIRHHQEVVVPVRQSPLPPVRVPDVSLLAQSVNISPAGEPVRPSTQRPPYEQSLHYVTTYKPHYSTILPKAPPVVTPVYDYEFEDNVDNSYNLLNGYDLSKALPTRVTSENLESSIKTLSKILLMLQKANVGSQSSKKYTSPTKFVRPPPIKVKPTKQYLDYDDEGSTPGRAGVDYPNLDRIPETSFSCKQQRYKGFFGDPETNCQVWHYCDLNGGQASFLCPNGTIFSQVALTCDWWFNVKCASTAQLYVLNERLYKYILPQKPSFPEDFAGPLVDRYLAQKFRELEEEKAKNETLKEMEENSSEEDERPAHETNEAKRSLTELSERMSDQ